MSRVVSQPKSVAGAPREVLQRALAHLAPELHDQVLQSCAAWTVPAGKSLLEQDQCPDVCYGLAVGMLQLQQNRTRGRASVMADLLEPGRWVGCEHLVANMPLPFGVTTLCESTVLVMRRSVLQTLLERQPTEATAWMLRLGAGQTGRLTERMGMLASASADQRIRWVVRLLAERFADSATGARRVSLRLTQSQIAAVAGASRQRTNETLGVLRQEGLLRIAHGRMEVVPDLASESLP